jgi:hypothetical protein
MKRKEAKELTRFANKIPDPELQKELIDKIRDYKAGPIPDDKWVYRSVVWALGIVAILCVCFTLTVVLRNMDSAKPVEIPDIFLAIASAAVGALAGLLAPSPITGSE